MSKKHILTSKKDITQALHKQRLLVIYIGLWNLSIKDCPQNDASTQKQKSLTTCLQSQRRASPLIKIISERVTRKCHFTQVCQHTVWTTGSHFQSCFALCKRTNTIPYFTWRDGHGSDEVTTQCSTSKPGLQIWNHPFYSVKNICALATHYGCVFVPTD